MVSWICPDCACECAPTDHECPDCKDLVQAGMLALAQTVQTRLGSLPPPPPVQSLVYSRFADPKVPDPLAPWPIETQPELAPVLGLFVPCVGASIQPDIWAEPEPVQQHEPTSMEPVPAEHVMELAPAEAILDSAAATPQDVLVEPQIDLAPAPVETAQQDGLSEPVSETVTAAVETIPESVGEVAAEPKVEFAPAPLELTPEIELAATPDVTIPENAGEVPTVPLEALVAEPVSEPVPAPVETIAEGSGRTAMEPQVELAPAPVEMAQELEIEIAAAPVEPAVEPEPLAAETIPESVGDLAVKPDVESAPAAVEMAQELEIELTAAPVEPAIEPEPLAAETIPESVGDLAVKPDVESAPAAVEMTQEPELVLTVAPVEPAIELGSLAAETIPESVGELAVKPEVDSAPAPVETTQEPEHELTAAQVEPIIELGPLAETIPESVGELAMEPEVEFAPAPVEMTQEPEIELTAAPLEPAEESVVELAPTPPETRQEAAADVQPVLAAEAEAPIVGAAEHPTTELAPAEEPSPALPASAMVIDVLPVQEMMPGAVAPVEPKPSDTAEFRYPETQPEFPPIAPLVVSSPSGPVDQTTESVVTAPPPQLAPAQRKIKLPGWMVSLLVATGLSLGGAVIVRNMGIGNKPEPVSAATSQPGESAPAAGSPASYARFIEVTGLRVVVDLQRGSKVHYILVNHGPTILTNVQLRIDVYSAASSDNSRPLFTVTALVSNVEPSSSREMTASIDDLHDAVIPDWENLRPKVQVVSQ